MEFLCDESAKDIYILDYIDFTLRIRWKIIRVAKERNFFGNHMEVFRAALIHFKRSVAVDKLESDNCRVTSYLLLYNLIVTFGHVFL